MRLSFYTYSYTDKLKMPTDMCLERIAQIGYAGNRRFGHVRKFGRPQVIRCRAAQAHTPDGGTLEAANRSGDHARAVD